MLRRLKDQEDVARSSSDEGDSDGSDAALDGSDGACALPNESSNCRDWCFCYPVCGYRVGTTPGLPVYAVGCSTACVSTKSASNSESVSKVLHGHTRKLRLQTNWRRTRRT